MAVTDYRTLIDSSKTYSSLAWNEGAYAAGDGVQYRSGEGSFHEAVRLSEGAYLFLTEVAPTRDSAHTQVVEGDDWLHVQFRFSGSGFEQISRRHLVETPERTCIVSRYPQGSVIEREIPRAEAWKYACLYLSPSALASLLDVEPTELPESSSWMALQRYPEFRSNTLPLFPALLAPLSDVFSCNFRGHMRRAYMRAKSLELLATLVHALDESQQHKSDAVKLSAADLTKLAQARSIMAAHLENPLSLAELARRVGLNRTKLALGFKATYGDSVQAFWRDARLVRARELLQSGTMEVTEAAFSVGYSEISSFTRAFTRKFGVMPKSLKRKAGAEPSRPRQ